MSHANSFLGVVLCLTGVIGMSHRPEAQVPATRAPAPQAVERALPENDAVSTDASNDAAAGNWAALSATVTVSTRTFDLTQTALSDFGDLDAR